MPRGKNTLSKRAMKIRFLLRELCDASRSREVKSGKYLPGLISTALSIGGDDCVVRTSEWIEKFNPGQEKSYVNATIRMRALLNQMVEVHVADKYITGEPQQFAGDPSGWHFAFSLDSLILNDIKQGNQTLDQVATSIDRMIIKRFEDRRETQATGQGAEG